jgi:Pvc16 N-terminal domain
MSNSLAIASVSFVLVDLLNNGLIDRDISASVGDVIVTAWPPDKVDALQQDGKSQLNLFLYNVTQNQAWRNVGYPSRDASGNRIDNPPLALDLHYLLSAYGAEQFHSEILLGYGMQLFHETPFLPREAIQKSLSAPTQVSDTSVSVPSTLLNLFTSGLANQVEMIKIWPQTLTTEEISRLWTAFQAKYRSTAAYQCSVVLIQSETSTKKALPVRHRMLKVNTLIQPVISSVLGLSNTSPPVQSEQPILPGYSLVIQGTQLQGDSGTIVVIGGEQVYPAAANITPTQIVAQIPSDLLAGTQSVRVVQPVELGSPPTDHNGVSSQTAAFVLQPVIENIAVTTGISNTTGKPVDLITLTVDPPVGTTQEVLLLLNQISQPASPPPTPLAYSFVADPSYSLLSPPPSPPPPSTTVSVPYSGVTPGTYLVRIQVDGAQSLLTADSNGVFNGPVVNL